MLSLNCEYVHNVRSYYKALLNRFNSDKSGTFSSNCYLTTTIIILNSILFTQKNKCIYKVYQFDR